MGTRVSHPLRPSWQPELLEQPGLRGLGRQAESRGCSSGMEIMNNTGKAARQRFWSPAGPACGKGSKRWE